MACCKSTPTLNALRVELSATTATIVLDGILPVSGCFNVKVRGCCLSVCSALPIALNDAAGTTITNIIGRCGNQVLLNKVAVQARRHKCLHFARSSGTPTLVVLQDKICAPTPVITTTAALAATSANAPKTD